MNNFVNFHTWLKRTLTFPDQTQTIDLESWRHWLLNAAITLVVIFTFPVYLVFILPLAWRQYPMLVFVEIAAYAAGAFHILTKGRTFLKEPFYWLLLLQIILVGYYYYVGPAFNSTAWLVMIAVLWAAFYGLWVSVISVAVSIASICLLYWGIRPATPGWLAFYDNPRIGWSGYLATVIWMALNSGVIVGFLLERIDRSLKNERLSKKSLAESETRYRALFDYNPDGIVLCDMRARVLDVNRALVDILEYERDEIIGKSIIDFAVEEPPGIIVQRFADLKAGILGDNLYEFKYINKSGMEGYALARGWRICDEASMPVAIGVHVKDISTQKALEDANVLLGRQLQQAQKLEAIGTLAGGIAHDFNNLLSGILGYTELAQMDLANTDHKAKTYLDRLLEAGERGRGLVQQILRFSRQEQSRKSPLSVSAVVKEVIKLLKSTLPTTIRIDAKVGKGAMIITADATQIHQIVMNLCTNAYQAMRDGFGTLGITLEKVRLENERSFLTMTVTPGEYIRLTVSDTGEGIAPEHLEKIFDPYFTTKEIGRGTGLGLSVTVGLVKEHGGLIEVQTEPDKGTTFNLYLPFEQNIAPDRPQGDGHIPSGKNELIMVVDDERFFLEIVSEHLSRLGYRVDAHASSMAALGAFRQDPGKYDLVISDQTMPEMTGVQLISELTQIRSDIPCILCTGYSDKITEQNYKEFGITSLLLKPVTRKEMADAVSRVLA